MFAEKTMEASAITGTGSYQLGTPVGAFKTWRSQFATLSPVFYCAENADGTIWEIGYGTLTYGSPDNALAAADPIPVRVPRTATAAGIIRALHRRGILKDVDAVVAQADELTQRLWARAPVFDREDPALLAVARALELEDQLDDLFLEANASQVRDVP